MLKKWVEKPLSVPSTFLLFQNEIFSFGSLCCGVGEKAFWSSCFGCCRDTVPEIIGLGPYVCYQLISELKYLAYLFKRGTPVLTRIKILSNTCMYVLCNLFSADATLFLKIRHKKLLSKVAYLWQFGFFFLSAAPIAQKSPELNICFIDACIQWSEALYLGAASTNQLKVSEVPNCYSLIIMRLS